MKGSALFLIFRGYGDIFIQDLSMFDFLDRNASAVLNGTSDHLMQLYSSYHPFMTDDNGLWRTQILKMSIPGCFIQL